MPIWLIYLLGSAGIAAVGFGGGFWLEHRLDLGTVAEAQAQVSDAQKQVADLRADVADKIAANERQRATNAQKALDDHNNLSAKIIGLQSDLSKSDRARAETNAKLQQELANAPKGDARDLGPAALHYLDGVRDDQANGGQNGNGQPAP